MRQKDSAICLRTTDYSETSQVVHFFTRETGVVHLLAKGTKRPKSKSGGAIDILSEGDLVFIASQRNSLGVLVEFAETISRTDLRRDAFRLNAAVYMVELTAATLAEADAYPELFDLLHNALIRLGQADAPAHAVLAFFQWRVLQKIGLLGQMESCVACGRALEQPPARQAGNCFSSIQGGLLCGGCGLQAREKYAVDADTLEALEVLRSLKPKARAALTDTQAQALNRLLHYHVSQQIGKPLKMARYVLGESR